MDATRPTVTFTEDDNFGRLAVMAGIQRLLGDIGYETGTIDGFGGVRTREAISAFKLRYQIRGNPSNSDLLARLLDTAAEQSEERGLIMCNKTDYLILSVRVFLNHYLETFNIHSVHLLFPPSL